MKPEASTNTADAARVGSTGGSAFNAPPFNGRVKEPLQRFAWWGWHPNYPYWSKLCWGGATEAEALAEIDTAPACGMDVYHCKLIREDAGGVLVEVADRPCQRPEVWERIAAQRLQQNIRHEPDGGKAAPKAL